MPIVREEFGGKQETLFNVSDFDELGKNYTRSKINILVLIFGSKRR